MDQYNINIQMWKSPTVLMDQTYPFGAVSDPGTQKHLIRKKLNKSEGQLQKTKILASLKHECLIKLEGLQQQNNDYWMMYEYVPQSIDKWFPTVNRQFIENYEQRLILFARYLADKTILVTFKRENMGVSDSGDAKYYLDTNFVLDPHIDKLALKKKYKEEIRQLIQYYIDKKNAMKPQNSSKPLPTQKKQNSKVLKILEAIEKGKANLCAQTPKQANLALVSQQNSLFDNKSGMKPMKNMNIQNIFIQKEVNKVNKIQVMMGNKPVEVLQQEFKRQYASSSFYINGIPTMKIEREGQARRLFSPSDKLTRFEQVKYKEYKTMKTSGQVYVQDFINVLQADDAEKLTLPGSPRGTLHGSPRSTLHSPPKITLPSSKMIANSPQTPKLAIEPQQKKQVKKNQQKQQSQLLDKITSPRSRPSQNRMFTSEKEIKNVQKQEISTKSIPPVTQFKPVNPPPQQVQGSTKVFQLQKKVSQAIANSMNAISKFKNAKNNQVNS